jgi:hypothetical protein
MKSLIYDSNGTFRIVSNEEYNETFRKDREQHPKGERHYRYIIDEEDAGFRYLFKKSANELQGKGLTENEAQCLELYYTIARPIWRQKKAEERARKCKIPGKRKTLATCKEKCTPDCSRYDQRSPPQETSFQLIENTVPDTSALTQGHSEDDYELLVGKFIDCISQGDPEIVALAESLLAGLNVKQHAEKLHALTPRISFAATYQAAHRKHSKLKALTNEFLKGR